MTKQQQREARDPYVAIMVASAKGKGLHLTAQEVEHLSYDDAISTRATTVISTRDYLVTTTFTGWEAVKP